MSSEPSVWRFVKFIFILDYFLIWLLSSQLIGLQIVAEDQKPLLADNEVSALNVIADKLKLQPVPHFTANFCSESASSYHMRRSCNCSYESHTICHITEISLESIGLTGTIPKEFANLTYLQNLDLGYNKLHGEIPVELGSLQFLHTIDLENNMLTGLMPPSLGNISYLQILYLNENNLNGTLPETLGNLKSLSELDVSKNNLDGTLPETLGNLKSLSYLDLSENNLNGTLPETLGNLTSLSYLWLESNYLTGELPKSYGKLSGLYVFSISGNSLSGPFPNFINKWAYIRILSLYGNNFVGRISPEIFKLSTLEILIISDVWNSRFQFPQNSTLSRITILVMRNCSITGAIPGYLFNVTLKYLDLSFNSLTGGIPDPLTDLNLTYMSFANNKLNGTIPAWIGTAERTKIDLSNNTFAKLGFKLQGRRDLNLFGCCNQSTAPTVPSLKQIIEKRCPGKKHLNHSLFINCGGEETDIGRNHYDSDNKTSQFYVSQKGNWAYSNSGGFFIPYVTNSSEYIKRAKCGISVADAPLYEKARHSSTSLKYYGFCLREGSYNVTLHFAEIVYAEDEDHSSSMKRIFDVYIQGERQLTDFNIKDEARDPNKRVAIKNFTANVSNSGILEIHLYGTRKGSSANSNGPLISAIDVTPEFPIEDDKGLSPAEISLITVASIVFAALLLLALAWAMGCFGKEELHEINVGLENPVTLKELKDATRQFSKEMEIGHGSFGTVFRAELQPKYNVAVKRFVTNSTEGIHKLKSELYNTLQKLTHENVVRLFDVYVGKGMYVLIYEFMENRSLQDVLFGDSNRKITLEWKERYKICLGIASGLKYLHDELPKGPRFKMVHRGIKPSNILLDGNLNAKISDFGNSVLYEDDYQEKQFKVMKEEASHGYMAPEYLMFDAISCKYDVYGYGVVILEIVCGRINAGQKLNQEQLDFLVDEVVLAESKGRLHEMVDKNLSSYDQTEAMTILKLAVKCTNISASFRPTMSEVVSVLKGEKTIDDIWKPTSTQILCQNCFKSLHEDDGAGDQPHA